jgi:cytochrome c biogenesis protein CcmG, thiol:disulfide interchange protein DsbE
MDCRGLRAGLVLVVGLLVLLAGAVGCGGDSPAPTSSASVEVIEPADFDVAAYAGQPLVINFFGSWCGPCNEEAPALAEFAAAHPDVRFVGIAVSDKEDDAVAFMTEYGLDYPVVVDDNSLLSAWGIQGVPTTVFLTSAGSEADRIVGAAGREQFEDSLAKAQ